jgi:hypothetical protein
MNDSTWSSEDSGPVPPRPAYLSSRVQSENQEAGTQLVPGSSSIGLLSLLHIIFYQPKKKHTISSPNDLVPVNTGGHPLHLQGIFQEPFLARSKHAHARKRELVSALISFSLFLEPSPATVERGAICAPAGEVAVLFRLRRPSGPRMCGERRLSNRRCRLGLCRSRFPGGTWSVEAAPSMWNKVLLASLHLAVMAAMGL